MKPRHIGIIPDGNRRWAKKNGISEYLAHSTSGNYLNLSRLFDASQKEGIKVLSIWAFSTENWKRDRREVNELLGVIERGIDSFTHTAPINRYRFRMIGRRNNLSERLVRKIQRLEEETSIYNRMQVVIGIDYGGRDELLRAINKAILKGEEVDEEIFRNYLDTLDIPDPDLIIRTGGERRISGYMPFQSVYSEFIFVDKLFPDFTPDDLIESIRQFEDRKRRFGK